MGQHTNMNTGLYGRRICLRKHLLIQCSRLETSLEYRGCMMTFYFNMFIEAYNYMSSHAVKPQRLGTIYYISELVELCYLGNRFLCHSHLLEDYSPVKQ